MRKKVRWILVAANIAACTMLAGCGSSSDVSASAKKTSESEKAANISENQSVLANTDGENNQNEREPEQENGNASDSESGGDGVNAENTSQSESESSGQGALEDRNTDPGITAVLLQTHYAGDILAARDFNIQVRKEDGTTLINPQGWTAEPLELVEGDNEITVCYGDYSTVITVNAGIRPEGLDATGSYMEVAEPVPIVNTTAFALSGPAVLGETSDMGQEYLDKIIFLGDSRTYSYKSYGVLSGGKNTNQVWTPRNGTMTLAAQGYTMILYPETGEDISIRDAVAMKKPEYMVIGLGMNGVSFMSEDTFKAEYRSLVNDIKSISPDTKVILNSIYPVANYYAKLDQINNTKIAECNRWIMEIAEETGTKYLNTAEALADADGWLNLAYDNGGEGSHLNRPGNEIVMRYIRTHGYQ